jgi:hypothetical protein
MKRAGPTDQTVNLITSLQEELGQITVILARNICNQCFSPSYSFQSSSIFIIESFNVVLFYIITVLNFNNFKRYLFWIL